MSLRVVSYGGGVQSTSLLVLAAEGRIDFQTFLFANVGDDSEHPATLAYVHDVAIPYAAAHGIEVHELRRRTRDGEAQSLLQLVQIENTPSIPVFLEGRGPAQRGCTSNFKIRVIGKWLKAHGATESEPATVAIGISVDEIHRANTNRRLNHEEVVYPLLDLGMRRMDCLRVIAAAGLPIPHKSACFFCPFTRPRHWETMMRDEPELFERACSIEDALNVRRAAAGRPPVFLTRHGIPLRDVVSVDQLALFDEGDGSCDSGWCMT